jgi:putative transposase
MGKKTLKKSKNIEINNDCRIIHERNKYWIVIPVPVVPPIKVETSINYCGIDPGIRTFLTSFSNNGVVEYNQNKILLKKLNKKMDLLNSKMKVKKKQKYKIEERKENIINELHWKSINDILNRNDYVFYGDIKSHDIVKKSNNRFLNRDINDLKFYKFKERLMYKASLLNKHVLNVNEMYTTKACSSCGNLNNVGIKEIYKCENKLCNNLLLRDVSAAKNILMKGIVKYL